MFNQEKYDASTLGKGIVPFEAMNSMMYFFDQKTCPPKHHFDSELNGTKISDSDYSEFCRLWELFGFENMLDW